MAQRRHSAKLARFCGVRAALYVKFPVAVGCVVYPVVKEPFGRPNYRRLGGRMLMLFFAGGRPVFAVEQARRADTTLAGAVRYRLASTQWKSPGGATHRSCIAPPGLLLCSVTGPVVVDTTGWGFAGPPGLCNGAMECLVQFQASWLNPKHTEDRIRPGVCRAIAGTRQQTFLARDARLDFECIERRGLFARGSQ